MCISTAPIEVGHPGQPLERHLLLVVQFHEAPLATADVPSVPEVC